MNEAEHKTAAPPGASRDESDHRALTRYLEHIGKTPLLDAEDEVRLSHRIENGYVAAIRALAEANLRLVVHIAYRYAGRGVPIRELIAAGNLGLMQAAKAFRARPDARFGSYAVWWIRRHIFATLLRDTRTARIPLHRLPALSSIHRARLDYLDENGREPSPAELAELTGLRVGVVISLLAAGASATSLQSPASEDAGSRTLEDAIPDHAQAPPSSLCERNDAYADVERILKRFPPRELAIIRGRFGLDDGSPKTCEELGARFGMTRERVRQIQDECMRKIRRLHLAGSEPKSAEDIKNLRMERARNEVVAEFAAGLGGRALTA